MLTTPTPQPSACEAGRSRGKTLCVGGELDFGGGDEVEAVADETGEDHGDVHWQVADDACRARRVVGSVLVSRKLVASRLACEGGRRGGRVSVKASDECTREGLRDLRKEAPPGTHC